MCIVSISDFHTLFFFQAEDGIRVVAVTGVQTCALPISIIAPTPSPVEPAPATVLPSEAEGPRVAAEPTAAVGVEPGEQIGRASCRERGESSAVALSLKIRMVLDCVTNIVKTS